MRSVFLIVTRIALLAMDILMLFGAYVIVRMLMVHTPFAVLAMAVSFELSLGVVFYRIVSGTTCNWIDLVTGGNLLFWIFFLPRFSLN
jgi:hypothetical protein